MKQIEMTLPNNKSTGLKRLLQTDINILLTRVSEAEIQLENNNLVEAINIRTYELLAAILLVNDELSNETLVELIIETGKVISLNRNLYSSDKTKLKNRGWKGKEDYLASLIRSSQISMKKLQKLKKSEHYNTLNTEVINTINSKITYANRVLGSIEGKALQKRLEMWCYSSLAEWRLIEMTVDYAAKIASGEVENIIVTNNRISKMGKKSSQYHKASIHKVYESIRTETAKLLNDAYKKSHKIKQEFDPQKIMGSMELTGKYMALFSKKEEEEMLLVKLLEVLAHIEYQKAQLGLL